MRRIKLSNVGLALILVWGFVSCWGSVLEFELATPSASVENGKKKMSEIMQQSSLPMDGGSCWKSALEYLQTGCRSMTEETQSRMTLRFVSCFNEMFGLPMLMCESATPIQDCMKQLDASGRATFRDYFLHTQDMCYYLRQEVWQEQTNSAVNRLTETASDVTMQMEVQKMIQEQIYVSQQESLKVQSNLKKDNEDLYSAVVKVKDVFNDFSETAKEHQLISSEIFDKLSKMQQLVAWIQGEMSLLDMIFFYFAGIIFGYFATATTRTRAARFWLIVLFMAAIFIEKGAYVSLTEQEYSPEEVQMYRWYIRKIASIIGCFIVIVEGARYRDIQTVNNDMLAHISFTMEKLTNTLLDKNSKKSIHAPNQASLQQHGEQQIDNDSSDDDNDTFSNYSSDDSEDNLDHELKELVEESKENNENRQPSVVSRLKYFARAKELSPSALHSYNLRERSATPCENPTVVRESPTEFARAIKRKTTKTAPAPARLNYFSSDDEL